MKKIVSKLNKYPIVLLVAVISASMLLFQNCSKGFQAQKGEVSKDLASVLETVSDGSAADLTNEEVEVYANRLFDLIEGVLRSDTALLYTVGDSENESFACIREGRNCVSLSNENQFHNWYRLKRLYSASGQALFSDLTGLHSGFKFNDSACQAFDLSRGNDLCALQIDLRWAPHCNSNTDCYDPDLSFRVQIAFRPGDQSRAYIFNHNRFSLTHRRDNLIQLCNNTPGGIFGVENCNFKTYSSCPSALAIEHATDAILPVGATTCTLRTCDGVSRKVGNKCRLLEKPCTSGSVAHATLSKSFLNESGSDYSVCKAQSCESGFAVINQSLCESTTTGCSGSIVGAVAASRDLIPGSYPAQYSSECHLLACLASHRKVGNTCQEIQPACQDSQARSGFQFLQENNSYTACLASMKDCTNKPDHVVSYTQSLSIATQQYNACVVQSCTSAAFQKSGNSCTCPTGRHSLGEECVLNRAVCAVGYHNNPSDETLCVRSRAACAVGYHNNPSDETQCVLSRATCSSGSKNNPSDETQCLPDYTSPTTDCGTASCPSKDYVITQVIIDGKGGLQTNSGGVGWSYLNAKEGSTCNGGFHVKCSAGIPQDRAPASTPASTPVSGSCAAGYHSVAFMLFGSIPMQTCTAN